MPETPEHVLAEIRARLDGRAPSRLVGPSSAELAKQLADGEAKIAAPQAGTLATGLQGRFAKALAESTASAGGVLVPVELSSVVLEAVRARSVVLAMGPTRVDVAKEFDVPAISSGATAYWLGAENSAIPTSEQTFSVAALLRPKELATMVPISNRLLRDAQINPSLEDVVVRDMSQVIALAQDLGFMTGTGTSGQPLGIVNTPGLTPSADLAGAQLNYDSLMDAVANLRNVNASFNKPGWLLHPRLLTGLLKTKDSTGRYLTDAGLLTIDPTGAGGRLLGFPFRSTTQLPTTAGKTTVIFSSDWDEAWIGTNLELTVEASNSASYTTDGGTTWVSAWQNRQSVYRAVTAIDIGLRRPAFFTTLTNVGLPT